MGGMNNWMGAMMGNPFMNLAQGSSNMNNMMFPQNMPYPGMMPPNINQAQFLQGILTWNIICNMYTLYLILLLIIISQNVSFFFSVIYK